MSKLPEIMHNGLPVVFRLEDVTGHCWLCEKIIEGRMILREYIVAEPREVELI